MEGITEEVVKQGYHLYFNYPVNLLEANVGLFNKMVNPINVDGILALCIGPEKEQFMKKVKERIQYIVSVDNAVDVAKEAAAIVLLEKDLNILIEGVKEGRKTFANTIKYIFITTSANFGNMFSMAGASLFLPILPMLPKQILLTNLLSDIPAIYISTDNVDQSLMERPRQWNIKFIYQFMIVFGIVSSVFDYLTFIILLYVLKVTPEVFQTSWFFVSVATELIILLVMRTHKVFFKSKPSKYLLINTLLMFGIVFALIYIPFGNILGFTPLSIELLFVLSGIILLYVLMNEITKWLFYKKVQY